MNRISFNCMLCCAMRCENSEIEALADEQFFHADYEATLVETYGLDYEESLVVEGGVVAQNDAA